MTGENRIIYILFPSFWAEELSPCFPGALWFTCSSRAGYRIVLLNQGNEHTSLEQSGRRTARPWKSHFDSLVVCKDHCNVSPPKYIRTRPMVLHWTWSHHMHQEENAGFWAYPSTEHRSKSSVSQRIFINLDTVSTASETLTGCRMLAPLPKKKLI